MSHNSSFYFFIERIIMPTVEHRINFDNVVAGVKSHIKRHQIVYSLGAGFGIAGITCFIMKGCIEALAYGGAYGPETADTLVTNQPFFSFLSGQHTVIIRNNIGRPSYLVHDIDTDLYYRSQNAVAKALEATDKMVSDHINGLLPHVKGHHLERVPIASK
jgi:hypothetical protein